MNAKSRRNLILLIIAALIWGVAFVAQSEGGDAVGPFSFNFIRFIIGGAVLAPLIAVLDKMDPARKPQTKEQKKTLLVGGVCCGAALFFASISQQIGITMGTSVGKAGFITACYIVMVPILGLFIHKKCPVTVWISVVIALVGLYLLCMTSTELSISLPDVLIIICAVLFGVQILFVDYYSPMTDGVRLAQLEFFVCGGLSLIPTLIFDVPSVGIQTWFSNLATWDAWIPILYAGVMSSGVAYTLQIIGQKGLNPTLASLAMSLESVFAVLAGWILLHQNLSVRELFGCLLVFIAVILAQVVGPDAGKRPKEE